MSTPKHPGKVLYEEFLPKFGVTANALSVALEVPPTRIHDIVHERRSVTVDTAMRLAKYFGTSPDFWLQLQMIHDTFVAKTTMRAALARIRRCEKIAN